MNMRPTTRHHTTASAERELHALSQEVIGAGGSIEASRHQAGTGQWLIWFTGEVMEVPFHGVIFPTGRIVYGYMEPVDLVKRMEPAGGA